MSKETIEYIFDPFYRADKSRSQKIQGYGLGMSIVKLILDKYHCEIKIRSKEGEGSCIQIVFKNTLY